jgi:nitrite reductase/ring-hydroxylating ferredoxin subunit
MSTPESSDSRNVPSGVLSDPDTSAQGAWHPAFAESELSETGRKLWRIDGRQIAVFKTPLGLYACNNRCPHEGYPLLEGTTDGGCVLTCNWHNWKFDLESGETLTGGDQLRQYPVRVNADGMVEIDLTEPPVSQQRDAILAGFDRALHENDFERLSRELARLKRIKADPVDGLRKAFDLRKDRFEYGTTHAMPGAADWLLVRDELEDERDKLACLSEAVGHIGWDTGYRPAYPYTEKQADWSETQFAKAIEAEDEETAVALVRGAIAAGKGWDDLRPAYARAAMRHYANFGHSVIYVAKTGPLLDQLGRDALESLVLPLTRHLTTATREDLIPEFRAFNEVRADWQDHVGDARIHPEDLLGLSVRRVLERIRQSARNVEATYHALVGAAAFQLLHFDNSVMYNDRPSVGDYVNWLDLTHGLTAANAVRHLAEDMPELWAEGLLQIGCFIGRNAKYGNASDVDRRRFEVVGDTAAFFAKALEDYVLAHGCVDHIEVVHRLKMIVAMREEVQTFPDAPWRSTLLAGVNRYLQGDFPRRNPRRIAHQSMMFVARE